MKLGTSKDHYYSPIGLSWAELLLFHTSVQLKKKRIQNSSSQLFSTTIFVKYVQVRTQGKQLNLKGKYFSMKVFFKFYS